MTMIGGPSCPSYNSVRLAIAAIVVVHTLAAAAAAVPVDAKSVYRSSATCPDRHWLDTRIDGCAACTKCADERAIVLRPCQPHADTVCGTLNDLEFEWSWMAPVDVHGGPAASGDENPGIWNDQHPIDVNETSLPHWQIASLVFAAAAFILFLVAVTYILYQHAKQWRHMENMERRFDRDVEQLSARLMHNIVDLRSIENGRIILNETPTKDRTINPREVRCVYLEQLLIGKDLANSQVRGNVYTEETKG